MRQDRQAFGGVIVALCCAITLSGGAGRAAAGDWTPADRTADVAGDVGTGWNVLTLPAAAFTGRDSSITWATNPAGYRYRTSGSSAFWAPVSLPTGAAIGYLTIAAYDSSASGSNVVARLWKYSGYGTLPCALPPNCPVPVPPDAEFVVLAFTDAGSGYQYRSSIPLAPVHTVVNDVVQGGGYYVVEVDHALLDGSQAFKGVDIWWKRQIAPPPATASFTDVPTNAQFFAEVEALKASGITAGCTATLFCPESPLTRRQMTAFLARAMGLYWPN